MNTNVPTPTSSSPLHYFNVKLPPGSTMWLHLLFHSNMQDLCTFIFLTIIKIFRQQNFSPVAAAPSLSPPGLLASLRWCPSSAVVSAVPPQRQNDPQAVNLNEAESWAGLGRTRPYGSVSDRGDEGDRKERCRKRGEDEGVGQCIEKSRKLTWQNEKEQNEGVQLRTRKKRDWTWRSPGRGRRRRNTEVHSEEQITWH